MMLTSFWTKVLVALGALCLVILVVIGYRHLFRPEPPSPLPPAIVRRVDSAEATRRESDSTRHDTRVRDSISKTSTESDEARARRIASTYSVSIHPATPTHNPVGPAHTLDSLSVAYWHARADSAETRADSLAAGLGSALRRIDSLKVVAARDSLQITRDSTRLLALTNLNRDLVSAANHVNQCRVAYVVPCPSRKAAFVSGAIATGLVFTVLRSRSP